MSKQEDKLLQEIYNAVLAIRTEGVIHGKTKYFARADAEDILAKVKEKGYAQVWKKCPDCAGRALKAREAEQTKTIPADVNVLPMDADCPTCKGTGKIYKYVPWDREKVAILFKDRSMSFPYMQTCYEFADQLHKLLRGE